MINLAVVGCGRMASDLARKSVKMDRARIAAIYDPDPAALAEKCAEFNADPIAEIEGLNARSDVDAFLIGSPPLYHYDNVLTLAPIGKPIYCEKPLCTTAALCIEMIDACSRYGVKLFVGQVLRLFPLFWRSHEVIESGVVGTPQLIVIRRSGFGGAFTYGWRTRMEESGGMLLEVNSHELDYMLFVMGEAQSVLATGFNLTQHGDFDDAMVVQIRFKNGGRGVLHSSLSSPVGEYGVHIQCSRGNIVHGGFGGELRYKLFNETDAVVIKREDLNDRPDPYDWELTSFFDWVEKDTPPLFTGETGRANVAVADAAYRSLASGVWENVG